MEKLFVSWCCDMLIQIPLESDSREKIWGDPRKSGGNRLQEPDQHWSYRSHVITFVFRVDMQRQPPWPTDTTCLPWMASLKAPTPAVTCWIKTVWTWIFLVFSCLHHYSFHALSVAHILFLCQLFVPTWANVNIKNLKARWDFTHGHVSVLTVSSLFL